MAQIYTLKWENKKLVLIDQTFLPSKIVYESFDTVKGVRDAIRDMKVRGAPAIGVAAAYGMAISAINAPSGSFEVFWKQFKKDSQFLATSRPTAVNLFWALERMERKAQELKELPVAEIKIEIEKEAIALHLEDEQINRKIGENLLSLLKDGDTVLTHCNAGSLATSKYGTALSPFYLAQEKGINLKVYADETRPRLQGSTLTALSLCKRELM